MIESMLAKNRYVLSLEGLGGLWISIATTLLETKFLVDFISRETPSRTLSPDMLSMLLAYIASVIGLPLVLAWIPGALKELSKMYRAFAERSCLPFRIPKLRTRLSLLGFAIPISSLCVVASIVLSNPLLALAGFVPTLIASLVILAPVVALGEHRRRIDTELPWFAVLLDLSESVGAGIKFLGERIRRTRILPAISKELDAIARDARLRSSSYIDSLMRRADLTPSYRLSRFLRGYASRLRSGSPIVQWLRMWILEEFMRSEFSYRMFSERASIMISQVAIGIYVFVPVVMAALGALSSPLMLIVPVVGTPALIALAYAIRPKTMDCIDRKHIVLPAILCIATSIMLFPLLKGYAVIAGWLLGIVAGIKAYSQVRECSMLRRDSFDILNYVTELRRIGLSIPSALKQISKESKLHKISRRRIEEVLQLHELGVPLTETIRYVRTPSFMFKFVVFSLGIMHESGASDPSVIQRLLETLRRIDVLEESSRKVALLFDALSVATIGIVIWIAKTLAGIVSVTSTYTLAATLQVFPVAPQLSLLIPIALLGYSIVSTILRTGAPIFELRQVAFLAIALLAVVALTLF
ncbi:MAG: type II secretion system F family protein [Crenarchaeota archaeon]|nr:type II secretion system F family protein [Thermoproteota archaeon]